MLEHLYDAGLVAIAGRRRFERLYDLTERVIPQAALDAPVPPQEEAMKQLICLAAKACGVGTFSDLTRYFNTNGWRDRSRMERLFGMKYSIEIYLPPAKRVYGYYVCPFLLGDTLVARCDLKADRARKMLMVQSAFLEPGRDSRRVIPNVVSELRHMQAWLELDGIEVTHRGDLAATLKKSVTGAAVPIQK